MLSFPIPVCVLHGQHPSVRTHHVSGVQTLPVVKATVLSGTNTVCIHPCTQDADLAHVYVPQGLTQCLSGTW